eukprot:11165890-Lingulodinium_polyedra.AAC.1
MQQYMDLLDDKSSRGCYLGRREFETFMEDLERAEPAVPSGASSAVPVLLTPRGKVKPKKFASATEYYD